MLRDGRMRALFIPFFGLAIPQAAGLYGATLPWTGLWLVGQLWFVLTAALIWHGNRWFVLRYRSHFTWFDHPAKKLLLLVGANVLYTTPLTVLMVCCWYGMADRSPIPWEHVWIAAAVTVTSVIVVTHVYETMFLIREREADRRRVERLERARVDAELAALRRQLDPHLVFNSLNTLASLIDHQPARAIEFTEHLADVYRYILTQRDADLVPLHEEMAFVDLYGRLLAIRFGAAIVIETAGLEQGGHVPPASIQSLIENVVKHNECSEQRPLHISVRRTDDGIVVENHLRRRSLARPTSGTGLVSLSERCRLLFGRDLVIERTAATFRVTLPVVP